MAIYNDGKHNNGVITKIVKDKEFYTNRAKKAKENRQQMVNDVVEMIMNETFNYKDVIRDCLFESFSKCTQHELKTWL